MASQAVTKIDNSPAAKLDAFRNNLERRAADFRMVLPSHITPEKFQRTVMTAVSSNPDLLLADRQSLLLSCMKCAQDALLPDGREAALVVFSTRKKGDDNKWYSVKMVQYMPMVFGLRKKVLQSGQIADITAKVVYRREVEEGAFIYEEGTDAVLRHRPLLDMTEEEVADDQIVAAYSMATTMNGLKSYEVMRRFEINRVRQVSQTGAVGRTDYQGNAITPKGPWVDWFPEQAKKTVIRRHTKTLPMSGDLIDVEAMDESQAAQSSVALFDAGPAAVPPRRIEDPAAEQVDQQTGEVLDPDQGSDQRGEPAREGEGRAAENSSEQDEKQEAAKLPGEEEDDLGAKIEARIKAANSVVEVADIAMSLPDDLTDDARNYLTQRAEDRKVEIRKANLPKRKPE